MNRFQQYLAASVLASFLLAPVVLRADCPDGTRDTTPAERQAYMTTLNALKAVPIAPAGWQLQTDPGGKTEAPAYTCKGVTMLTGGYEVTYVLTELKQLNQQLYQQRRRERDARIAALRKLSPEDQNAFDEFSRQGMQLSGESAKARQNKNLEEAARLRAQAMESYAKARAVQQAHAAKTEPQARALWDGDLGPFANPEVRVRLRADQPSRAPNVGAEKVQIAGVPVAFFDSHKTLVMMFGRDAAGREIRVEVAGDRERVLTVARLFTESSLRTLATN